MESRTFKHHRYPPEVIRHTVWLYFRFTLSLREVEAMLASRGITVSYESIRKWIIKFGPEVAWDLRRRKQSAARPWRLEESTCMIGERCVTVWQAIDGEGQILDLVLQDDDDADAARERLARLLPKPRGRPAGPVRDAASNRSASGAAA